MSSIPFDSAPDIEKISKELLKESRAYGILPTPVDKVVHTANLRIEQNISLGGQKQNFFSRTFEGIGKVSKKVLGLIDIRQKIIYLDLEQKPNRQRFIKLHEVAHDALDWQKEVLMWDDKETISPSVKALFEKEANFFASCVLFQLDVFDEEAAKLPLSLKSAMFLAKKFGASTQASLRRYVEYSKKRCALLVLERPNRIHDIAAGIRNFFMSPSFINEFGIIKWPESVDTTFPFVQDISRGRRMHDDGEMHLCTTQGQLTKFDYHYFDNTYNIFVFMKPSGEMIRSRTKIVLLDK